MKKSRTRSLNVKGRNKNKTNTSISYYLDSVLVNALKEVALSILRRSKQVSYFRLEIQGKHP